MTDLPTISRKHSWPHDSEEGYVRLHGSDCHDGNDRTERTCKHCGLVKITVHYAQGYPGREWRTKDGNVWKGEGTPPCLVEAVSG